MNSTWLLSTTKLKQSSTTMHMRVGWKVHRGPRMELCHSNETWHALNSTFPDTNCIVSFWINPHWISNSGLWNVVLETFWRRPGKQTKGVLFHQDNAPALKSVVAMVAVRNLLWLELVDHRAVVFQLFPKTVNLPPKTVGYRLTFIQYFDIIFYWTSSFTPEFNHQCACALVI